MSYIIDPLETNNLKLIIEVLRQKESVRLLDIIVEHTKISTLNDQIEIIEGCSPDFLTTQAQIALGTLYFRVNVLIKAGLVNPINRPQSIIQYCPNYVFIKYVKQHLSAFNDKCNELSIVAVRRNNKPAPLTHRGRFKKKLLM